MSKDNNSYYKIGDNCYVLDKYNKIKFCEVLGVLTNLEQCEVAYELRDLINYRFFVTPHENCSDTEAGAKKVKAERSERKRSKRAEDKNKPG